LKYRFGKLDIWFYFEKEEFIEICQRVPDFTKQIGNEYDGFIDIKQSIDLLKEALSVNIFEAVKPLLQLKILSSEVLMSDSPTIIRFKLSSSYVAYLRYRFGKLEIWLYGLGEDLDEVLTRDPSYIKYVGGEFDSHLSFKQAEKYCLKFLRTV